MVAPQDEGMVLQFADGSIQAVNPPGERILGLTAEQLLGRTSIDLPWQSIHEDGSAFVGETHPAMIALRTGKPCLNVVMGLYKPNGELVWLLLNSEPLFRGGGTTLLGVMTTFADITESLNIRVAAMKSANREVAAEDTLVKPQQRSFAAPSSDLELVDVNVYFETEEQIRLATTAANLGMWFWNITTSELVWTPKCKALFGLAADTTITYEVFLNALHPDDRDRTDEVVNRALQFHLDYDIEYRAVWADGSIHWIAAKGRGFYDDLGNPVRMMGTVQDISKSKKTEADLRESEERVRLATTAANLGMWFWDLITDELIWTPKCKAIFGVAPDTIMCHEVFLSTLHPDDRQLTQEAVNRALQLHLDYDIEYRAVWADGSVHWISAKGRGFYDDLGNPVRMMGTVQDISRSKKIEADLRESEERYRLLAETIPEMVWITNAEGLAIYVNQRWNEYTGLTLEETIGYGWRKVLHPDDLEMSVQLWTEALENGTPYEIDHRYLRVADNTYRWHLVRAFPFKDDQGLVLKWFGTCTDIHQQKQLSAERAEILEIEKAARAEAENANRIKDEFLAVLSHELRTPLNPILGWTQLLKTRKFDEAATLKGLETIERNAKLQIDLIDDLLDVSRILRGKLSLNFATVDLGSIINASIETMRLAAQAKSIEIHRHIEPNVGKVLGDFNRLQEILVNLLSNAIKFTPSGGRVDIVLGRWGQGDKTVQITVSDTGKGISSEFLPYVFEYFRQADSSTTRTFGGLGLGLAIVRYLVEMHGGTVAAESAGEGLGATFIVRLPLIEENNTESPSENQISESFNSLPLAGIRILVVDDEADTREFMSFLLQQYGGAVTVASSVSQAVKVFASSKPDILLSDLGMPVEDGYSLIGQIREMSKDEGGLIPAIALTAYAGESDRERVFAAGFQRHLAKPIEPKELLAMIADLLGRR